MKASLAMLLKTNVGKMSDNRSLAMFMKPNELKSLSGDVDEKKKVKRYARFQGSGASERLRYDFWWRRTRKLDHRAIQGSGHRLIGPSKTDPVICRWIDEPMAR
jgi:hypothetical protein